MSELNLHPPSLTFWQRRIVIMGWITYAAYYLGRVNLYMASMGYMYDRCIECTRGCPGSEMRPEYGEEIPIPTNATTLANPGGEGYSIFDQGNWDPACLTDEACEPEMENIT